MVDTVKNDSSIDVQQTPDNQSDTAGGTQAANGPSSANQPPTTIDPTDASIEPSQRVGSQGDSVENINEDGVINTYDTAVEKISDTPDASSQNENSLEQPKGSSTMNVKSTPGFSSERTTQDTSSVKTQGEDVTTPKFSNTELTQQQGAGNTQTPDIASSSSVSTNQAIEEQNMMDDFIARGAEKVSPLDSVAAENDLEITQNDSGMNVIDIASAPNGEVTIGGAMYQLIGDRTDDTGESIGQLFYDKTSDNYTSVEYGKVVNWGDTNPNKQV